MPWLPLTCWRAWGIGLAISIFFVLQGNMKRAYYLSREELAEADEITLDWRKRCRS